MQESFPHSLQSVWKKIGNHSVMILSTSSDNRVSARKMSVIVYNGRFYFQTDKGYLKYRQLTENPNAALCVDNFSIEGECRFIGKPLDEKNSFFAKLYKKYFYLSYKSYSNLESEVLVEFTPSLIYSWNYELTKPYMEYWDLKNESYKKEYK